MYRIDNKQPVTNFEMVTEYIRRSVTLSFSHIFKNFPHFEKEVGRRGGSLSILNSDIYLVGLILKILRRQTNIRKLNTL